MADGVELSLTPPEAVAPVEPAEAEQEIPLPAEVTDRIDGVVARFVDGLVRLDPGGAEFQRRVDDVMALGAREIQATAAASSRWFDGSLPAARGPGAADTTISAHLGALRRLIAVLDVGSGRGPRRRWWRPQRDAWAQFDDARDEVEELVGALRDSQEQLERDNAMLTHEQRALWTQLESLRQYAHLAGRLDEAVSARVAIMRRDSPGLARRIDAEVVFGVRQRRQEILTQLAVSMQGLLILQAIAADNTQLIRAVRTASTTTLTALRTSVLAADMLRSHQVAHERVSALVTTAAAAWRGVAQALDEIDGYERAAQPVRAELAAQGASVAGPGDAGPTVDGAATTPTAGWLDLPGP